MTDKPPLSVDMFARYIEVIYRVGMQFMNIGCPLPRLGTRDARGAARDGAPVSGWTS
jgi:hypothetical protein